MFKRSLLISLVLVSVFTNAAQLSVSQQTRVNEMNSQLQSIEDTASKNIESLSQALSSSEKVKDKNKIKAQIKINEYRQQRAQAMLEQNEAFVKKIEGMTIEEVDEWQKKIEEMKTNVDQLVHQ
ncbi:hypothetical protein L1D19_23275 [Vibrio natriegens]|uniref:hypothetical protein n=1 Tax=Vibrio natriegens TaxID=691 RepID=UPI001EFD1B78|nr:hypothetical protein [Vibrio natriegens]MCG9702990.1 hypothetical protein [Vibrio natriegens]